MGLTKAQVIEKLTQLWTEAGQKSNTNTYQNGRRVAFGIALTLIQQLDEPPNPHHKNPTNTQREKP